jgi:hypothetical protein
MSSQFDWRTEDERTAEAPAAPEHPRSASRLYRFLVSLCLGLALIAAAGWALWSQFQQQVDALADTTQAAALADHWRVEAAATRGDVELFNAWLSAQDTTWVYSQWALLRAGLYQDRRPFGLTVILGEAEAEVSLSADLNIAEVTTVRPYQTLIGPGLTETVRLRQTAVYRYGVDSKWILTPPDADFWGERREIRLPNFIVNYPARDQAVVERLAADLQGELAELCRVVYEADCPNHLFIILNLETDPASLAGLSNLSQQLTGAQRISLPTPTLVGLPADDAAYRALYRGYAVQFLSPLAGYLLDWECCRHDLYYAALLDWQFARRGLKPWPLTDADYTTLLAQSPRIEALRVNWYTALSNGTSAEDRTAVQSFVEFLLTRYGQEASWAERQRYFGATLDFRDWAALNQPQPLSLLQIEADWYDYIVERAMAAQAEPPLAMPEAALHLACYQEPRPVRGDDGIVARRGELTVWRYDFASLEPTAVFQQPFATHVDVILNQMRPLPDRSGVQLIATTMSGFQVTSHAWLWQGGAARQLWPDERAASLLDEWRLFGVDPTSQWLHLAATGLQRESSQLVQANSCQPSGDCTTVFLPGWPIWSPDGRRMIIIGMDERYDRPSDYPVYLADGDGQGLTQLGAAAIPLWVDNDTAVFFRREPEPYLDLLDWDEMALRPLFPITDLLALLPQEVAWNDSHFLQILPDPTNPRRWYIFASIGYWDTQRPSNRHTYIVAYDWVDGRFELIHYDDDARMAYAGAGMSSDGRYFSVMIQTTPLMMVGSGQAIRVLDAASGGLLAEFETIYQEQVEGGAIWSPDGRWLLILQDRALILYAPEYDYRYLFGLTPPGCELVAWAD